MLVCGNGPTNITIPWVTAGTLFQAVVGWEAWILPVEEIVAGSIIIGKRMPFLLQKFVLVS